MPDRSRVDVNDAVQLTEHWNKYAEIARHFDRIVTMAQKHVLAGNLSDHDSAQFQHWILMLEYTVDALRISLEKGISNTATGRIRQCYYHQRCVQVGIWIHAALAIYVGDIDSLRLFSRVLLRDEEQWPTLSKALLENALHGWKDWRLANDPQAAIALIARRILWREELEDTPFEEKLFLRTDDEGFEIAPEDIAESPAERYSLSDAVDRDPDLRVYATARQNLKHAAACKQLGWKRDSTRATAVQQRYLGWRRWIADQKQRGSLSDASRTTFFETLHQGKQGRAHGVHQHKRLKRPKEE